MNYSGSTHNVPHKYQMPPCWLWLPPQQSTNRCMNLINSIAVTSLINLTDTEQIVRHSLSPRTLAYLMLPSGSFLFLFQSHSTLLTPSISTSPTESRSQPPKLHSKVASGLGTRLLSAVSSVARPYSAQSGSAVSFADRPFFMERQLNGQKVPSQRRSASHASGHG